jgi:hypothetical protein
MLSRWQMWCISQVTGELNLQTDATTLSVLHSVSSVSCLG